VIGRSLLYPADGDVANAVSRAPDLVATAAKDVDDHLIASSGRHARRRDLAVSLTQPTPGGLSGLLVVFLLPE
jgi:hypothetical protein